MDLGGYSLTGPREANEDNYYVRDFPDDISFPNGVCAFIMISDGMGGYQGGDVASSLAVTAAESYLNQLFDMARGNSVDFDANVALSEIVQNSHEAILLEAQRRGGGSIGATFVGAFLSKTHAWVGHVGDSRAYLMCDQDAIQITEDHSQVGRMLSRGLITEEEAQNHPARNRIERALGFSDAQIELDEVDLNGADAMLLCSDGAYTVLGGMEMYAIMSGGSDARSSAKRIVKRAIKAGTDDNTTVVVATSFRGDPGYRKAPGATAAGNVRATKTGTLTGAEGVKLPRNAYPSTARDIRARNARRNAGRAANRNAGRAANRNAGRAANRNAGRAANRNMGRTASASQRRRRTAPAHSRARRRFSWRAAIPILIFLALLVIMVVVGLRACNQERSLEVSEQSPGTVQAIQETSANQGTATDDLGDMVAFTVIGDSEEGDAVLKYVDTHGMAYRFTDEEQFGISDPDPTVKPGSPIDASSNTQTYGHNDKGYRTLDKEQYLSALIADYNNYITRGGADYEHSPLAKVVGTNDYIAFLDKLSRAEGASISDIKCLILDSSALKESNGQ